MDKATTASRGSPRVWKELSPKKSNKEHTHNSAKIQKYFLLSINQPFLAEIFSNT